MPTPVHCPRIPTPSYRRLRAFAFDPMLSRDIDNVEINEVTLQIPWDRSLKLGPVDDYLEVVDYDPASLAFYAPVNLNEPLLLAQDGFAPSEGNPQFHQQMVYAVARSTIYHFEQALGRKVLWSPRWVQSANGGREQYVPRLRIYPHALREANAYYTPEKKALLFGYFPASTTAPGPNMPGETIFACLSHDIVAHETTHALLDGLHRRFMEPTNPDTLALHEAFADIVALFQHFTYPEVLRAQIARTRGRLDSQNLLGELAVQFGQAIGQYGALRSAIGKIDPQTHAWEPNTPDPQALQHTGEPHARGAILVAAVFDAFLTIYTRRSADLLRLATGGTGILPPGDIPPTLVERLAQEAAKTAQHVMYICIRAFDYCPPVDMDFGDYLRALITADCEMVSDDRYNYRLAVIEAFRRRGIYPHDVRNLSVESLLWHVPSDEEQQAFLKVFGRPEKLRSLAPDWEMVSDRKEIYRQAQNSQRLLHGWFTDGSDGARAAMGAAHLLAETKKRGVYGDDHGVPLLEVHAVRPARRRGPHGHTVTELVIEMTQRRRGYFDPEVQRKIDEDGGDQAPDFIYRGGCTLLVDPRDATVRYCIYKALDSESRLACTRRYIAGNSGLAPARATRTLQEVR